MIRAAGQGLSQHGIQVLGNPARAQGAGRFMQGVFSEAILFTQATERRSALWLVSAGDGTGYLPGGIGSHLAHTVLSLGQHGIVESSSRFQVGAQSFWLPCAGLQRQVPQKSRPLASFSPGT